VSQEREFFFLDTKTYMVPGHLETQAHTACATEQIQYGRLRGE
jgi:hypothetical protein